MVVKSRSVTISVSAPTVYLDLNVDKTSGRIGDTFTFYGNYMVDGSPVKGARISLVLEGVGEAAYGYTTTEGYYSIQWRADRAGTLTFHAEAPEPAAVSRGVAVTVSEGLAMWGGLIIAGLALGTLGFALMRRR
jgi:hypothetical protein